MAESTKLKRKTKTTKARTKKKTSGTHSILKSLPESVEHIEVVQQVAAVLEEMQVRVADVKEEANKELKKLLKRYEGKYTAIEKKVHQVTSEAKKQAQVSMIHLMQKWYEHKEKLPAPLAQKIENLVAQIGAKAMSSKTKVKKKPGPKPGQKRAAKATGTTVVKEKRKPGRPKKSEMKMTTGE